MDTDNYQGVVMMNYTEKNVPFTRTIEHKHFENTESDSTWVTWEFPTEYKPDETEPYYPSMIKKILRYITSIKNCSIRKRTFTLVVDYQNTNTMICTK